MLLATKMCDWSSSHLIHLQEVTSTSVVIGKGSYGQVIEVYVHGTLCAAKEVHPILVNGITSAELETTKQSFLTECVNASRIHHPNIVQVLGIHYPTPEAKLPWLVMEMMERSLKGFLEKHGKNKVPYHIKLSILVDISEGLEFLHGQDIIHRDLSSNNVLMTQHCVAKIADLGMAKAMDYNRMKTQTQVPGTLHFMPPETLLRKPRYGKPVDVFSLGCVACHVMSHQWPEPKDLLPEGSLTALTEVERRDEYLQSCSDASLRELVVSCLHNVPDRRPEISIVCAELGELKFAKNERSPFPMSMIELLDVAQKQRSQINKFIDTVRVMEAIIQEKDKKIHELLLKEIKKDFVSVDPPQNMIPYVIQDPNTAVDAAQNCARYANVSMTAIANREEMERKRAIRRKVEVDVDANLALQYGDSRNGTNNTWNEEREGLELPDEVDDSQYCYIQYPANAMQREPEREQLEGYNGTYSQSHTLDFDANSTRSTPELKRENRRNIEASNDSNFGSPQNDYVDLAPNGDGDWIKAIEKKKRIEKEQAGLATCANNDPQYDNIDLAACSTRKELRTEKAVGAVQYDNVDIATCIVRTEGGKTTGGPQYGNVDFAVQGFRRPSVNLDIPYDKKPVATPRANRDSMTLSSSYKSSLPLTLKFKFWYCAECELINNTGIPCEGCMNKCARFAGFCNKCDLLVPASYEEDEIDCPVCLIKLEAKISN